MRRHGLREAHTAPLVGMRTTAGEIRSWRTPVADAWREIDPYHLVEWGRTGTSYAALVLDCDNREAIERAYACSMGAGTLPTPNLTITRLATEHLHVGWMLARPVLRGEHARVKPLTAFARVSEFYCAALDADRGYVGVLASNPLDTAHYATTWLRQEPFRLDELAAAVPQGWRRSITQPGTDAGRNCWLFDRLMRFGGSPRVTDAEVEHRAAVLNGSLLWPLDVGEVAGVVKSVNGHYRAQWRARGWHQPAFLELQRRRGRRAGVASGKVRRAAVEERDRRIVARLDAGESTRASAAAEGVSQWTSRTARKRTDFRVSGEPYTDDPGFGPPEGGKRRKSIQGR